MNTLLSRIQELVLVCDTDERELIEEMVTKAAAYVQAVTIMETTARNYTDRAADELREAVSSTDKSRRNVHNSLISAVDIVNRICAMHNQPALYTGSERRREYGDFALALVTEIFANRG